MRESIVTAIGSLITVAKAKASFDFFHKGRKGDARALIEELEENSPYASMWLKAVLSLVG